MVMASQRDVGRPLKFQSVEELQQKIDAYFAECDPHTGMEKYVVRLKDDSTKVIERECLTPQVPYTITGLALALDTSRKTLLDYESGEYDNKALDESTQAEFSNTIKKAKLKIHNFAENRLFSGQIVAGIIFNLKNNFEWVDRKELTGADGNPINLGPEAAAVLANSLGELKNEQNSDGGSGAPAPDVPEAGEPTSVQPPVPEPHPEEPAPTA
jgi:hypothetical protein